MSKKFQSYDSGVQVNLSLNTSGQAFLGGELSTMVAHRVNAFLGINDDASSTNIFSLRMDQNSATRIYLKNWHTGANAYARMTVSSDAGDINLDANSVAAGALADLRIDATFTAGLRIVTIGATPISLATNGNTRLSILGDGTTRLTHPLQLVEQASTPANPASGERKLYVKTDGRAYLLDSAGSESPLGSGSGGINYIANFDAEANIAGWNTYKDTAQAAPVDGTGGTSTLTLSRSTSSPLRGAASFLVTKPNSTNNQGEGWSYDFTVPFADRSAPLTISFDYIVSSTFVAGESSDVRIWIYDVTNASLIQPAPYVITGGFGSSPSKFSATFQGTNTTGSYRLIFQVATTAAPATGWTFKFDNVEIAPNKTIALSNVSDWLPYTPTGSWNTNTTYTGMWRRVGDSIEVRINIALSGAPNATQLSLTPAQAFNGLGGLQIDTAKLPGYVVTDKEYATGYWVAKDTATQQYGGTIGYEPTNTYFIPVISAAGNVSSSAPFSFNNGDTVTLFIRVPIVGWASNIQTSVGDPNRVVSMRARGSTTMPGNSEDAVVFTAASHDTHGAYNASTGIYTVPVSGKYRISASLRFGANTYSAGDVQELYFWHNGGRRSIMNRHVIFVAGSRIVMITGTDTIDANAGDTFQIRALNQTPVTLDSGTDFNIFSVERIGGSATVLPTEQVMALYNNSIIAGTAATATPTVIDFDTKELDTHNSVTGFNTGYTSTIGNGWKWTAPVSGVYEVASHFVWTADATDWDLRLYKNNSLFKIIASQTGQVTRIANGSVKVNLVAGDTLQIVVNHQSGSGRTSLAQAASNWVSITLVK